MASEEMKVYDWDDMITDDGQPQEETVVLPEGNYPFEVIKVEKAWYENKNGGKIPDCHMAKVYMRIDGGELGRGFVVENLYLCDKMEWKAASFLRSIGMKKHGEPTQWRKLTQCDGETGRCQIYIDEYEDKNGQISRSNKLKKFFDREEEPPKKGYTKGAF